MKTNCDFFVITSLCNKAPNLSGRAPENIILIRLGGYCRYCRLVCRRWAATKLEAYPTPFWLRGVTASIIYQFWCVSKKFHKWLAPHVANHCLRLGVHSGVHSAHWRIFNISVMLSGYASASPSGALPVICVWGLCLVLAEGEFEKDTIVVE